MDSKSSSKGRCVLVELTGVTHSEGVGLLPGEGLAPGRQLHLFRQRLGHQEEHKGDVYDGDDGGQQHHQTVSVLLREEGSDGGAHHQAGSKRGRHLRENLV